MDKILKGIGVGVVLLILIGIFAFITGLFVMLLWNWLMPTIFGLGEITYIQGWGLAVLCEILFGSAVSTNKN